MRTVDSASEDRSFAATQERNQRHTHPETPSGPLVTLYRTPVPRICDAVVESHTHVCRCVEVCDRVDCDGPRRHAIAGVTVAAAG